MSFLKASQPVAAALPWLEDAPRNDNAPAWMKALRDTGAEAFAGTGLPHPKQEGWQYTGLRHLSETTFHYSAASVSIDAKKLPQPLLTDTHRIVLLNGRYQPQFSDLPAGVTVSDLMQAGQGAEQYLASVGDMGAMPFKALNTAYLRDGFVLKVDKNKDIEKSIEVLLYNVGGETAPAIYPRMLYWLGENSGVTIIERHMGEGVYFANSYGEAVLEKASHLKFYKLQEESRAAQHFSFLSLQQHKSSSFEWFSMGLGGQSARQEMQNRLIDSGIHSRVSGVYLINDHQNHDFTILMDHFEPDGKSVQNFRGVIDDQARAVFQGKIHVRRSAQKTDGYQRHHALLLSRQAEASAKPELEIYADDVKCSHGATSGHLDREAMFYLQSRGIPQDEAKALLVKAFLDAAMEDISYAPVREICQRKAEEWLEKKT